MGEKASESGYFAGRRCANARFRACGRAIPARFIGLKGDGMSTSMMTDDHADVAIKPPFLFLGALALGCLLSLVIPIGPRLASPNGSALAVGLTFVALGFALAAFSARAFRHAGTEIVPGRPANALVTTGPYKITRNPIYIGMTLVYFGLSIVMTSVWVLLLADPRADDLAAERGDAGGGLSQAALRRRPIANIRHTSPAGYSSCFETPPSAAPQHEDLALRRRVSAVSKGEIDLKCRARRPWRTRRAPG